MSSIVKDSKVIMQKFIDQMLNEPNGWDKHYVSKQELKGTITRTDKNYIEICMKYLVGMGYLESLDDEYLERESIGATPTAQGIHFVESD